MDGGRGLTIASYFYDYHRIGQASPIANFTSLAALGALVQYTLTFLGAPIAWFDQRAAEALGGAVVIAFIGLAIRLRRLQADPVFQFPLLIGIQTIGISLLAGLGRAWMGVDQAMSSRYTTFGVPLWCAFAALAVLAYRQEPLAARRRAGWALTTAALVGVMMSAWVSGQYGTRIAIGRSETLRFARRGLIVGRSQAHLLSLYPDVAVITQQRLVLRRLRLSVFRPSPANAYPLPDSP